MGSFEPSSDAHDLILQQVKVGHDDDADGHQDADPDDVEPELDVKLMTKYIPQSASMY